MFLSLKTFLNSPERKLDAFIVYDINKLVLSNESQLKRNAFHPYFFNEDFKSLDISSTLSALKEANDSLEFKVNQEIFGSSPDKKFKMLVKFWIKHFVEVGWIGNSFYEFCKDFDIKRADDFPAGHEGRIKERIVQRALLLSYSSFFEVKKLLNQLEVKVKYKHTKILLPKLKRIYPSLVSNDDIDFKKLTVGMSS